MANNEDYVTSDNPISVYRPLIQIPETKPGIGPVRTSPNRLERIDYSFGSKERNRWR